MILWFRKDLRLDDNPALSYAINYGVKNAVFITANKQWQQHNVAAIQIDFIQRHLPLLADQLNALDIQLTVIKATDFSDQINQLVKFCQRKNCSNVVANKEYEFNEQQRDTAVNSTSVSLTLFEADVILPRGKVLNKQREMYKVFTPFKYAWLDYVSRKGINLSPNLSIKSKDKESSSNDDFVIDESALGASKKWPLTNKIQPSIATFFNEKVHLYQLQRDIPSIKGTSGLSPYFAIGTISAKRIAQKLINIDPTVLNDTKHPHFSWLNELIWRDFYRHLLFYFPKLSKNQCFNNKYQQLPWPNNPVFFKAWCEGKTGYPIVDAAMKQLVSTGWMHNRLRMIVASFLTKHLLIDWRWGEKFFSQHLIDGDLAANNGGWQWSAGTGCDAQPYFRVFNPITQSKKFDPNGDFIRKYIPVLKSIPSKEIHFPHIYLERNECSIEYSKPIVEHKEARLTALNFYKSVTN